MTEKPERLGAEEPLVKKYIGRYWDGCPHVDTSIEGDMDAHPICDSCEENLVLWLIRETEEAVREEIREPMECGHPKACWVQPEPVQVRSAEYATREMAIDGGDLSLEGSRCSEDEWEEQEPYCSACVEKSQARREALEDVSNRVQLMVETCPHYPKEHFCEEFGCHSIAKLGAEIRRLMDDKD